MFRCLPLYNSYLTQLGNFSALKAIYSLLNPRPRTAPELEPIQSMFGNFKPVKSVYFFKPMYWNGGVYL